MTLFNRGAGTPFITIIIQDREVYLIIPHCWRVYFKNSLTIAGRNHYST